MLIDHDILIDAGTGVGDLSLAELALIDHVFVTHSHLDHVACLPFMVDTVGDMRNKPLTVYATEATLEIIQAHIFNWAIWPDFSEIPNREKPFMRYRDQGRQDSEGGGARNHPLAGQPHRAGGRLSHRFRRSEPGVHRRHRYATSCGRP